MDDGTFNLMMSILTWIVLIVGIAVLAYTGYCSRQNSKKLSQIRAGYDKFVGKERLARLRHRDFKAFCLEVNNMRAARRQKPIPVELLKKVQYNLMYSIDED